MKKQRSTVFKLLMASIIMSSSVSIYAQGFPPNSGDFKRSDYNTSTTGSVSDDFGGSSISSKWHRRKALNRPDKNKVITEEASFVKVANGKVICFGKQKKGGGIVTKQAVKYGFYTVKWKVTGFQKGVKSSYHPAIWSARSNGRSTVGGNNWIEIDLVEVTNASVPGFGFGAATQADAPARIDGKKITITPSKGQKAIMKSFYNDDINTAYHIYGIEYTPSKLQVWRKNGSTWRKLGRKITFNNSATGTISTIPKVCRESMFWYIGNLWTGGGNDNVNTKLVVDYFRYYKYKGPASGITNTEIRTLEDTNLTTGFSITQEGDQTVINSADLNGSSIEIFDFTGQTVQVVNNISTSSNRLPIDTSSLNSGVYILKLKPNGKDEIVEKLIIN